MNRHWIAVVSVVLGFYAIAPFLAPVLMAAGWSTPGKMIYWVYSFLCHQLPERSYFLFGPKISYSLPEIQSVWQNVVALPLAAGVLAPVGILFSPAVGAVLMSISTMIVAINAQLLRGHKLAA